MLGNDRTAGGSAAVVSGPANGSLTLNANGSFTYTPDAGFVGNDSFTYSVSDGTNTSNATVTLNVLNAVPRTGGEWLEVTNGRSVSGNLLTNDFDPDDDTLTVSLVSGPSHGDLVLNADGSYTYTADTNYDGPDSFTYSVSDGEDSSTATVSITVANPAPAASGDFYNVAHDTALTVTAAKGVLANDSGDPGEGADRIA